MSFLNIYSKRTISKIWLRKSGELCKIEFCGSFSKGKTKDFHISDFSFLKESNFNFSSFDSSREGKLYLDLENNLEKDFPGNKEIVETLCNGNIFDLTYYEKYIKKK